MPLKKSGSHGALQENIREMIRSGHKPKQAIAAALSNQRKYKHMAKGGMVDMEGSPEDMHEEAEMRSQARGSIDSAHDAGEAGEAINPIQDDPEGLSPNVMDEQRMAEALQSRRYSANQNSHSYEADDSVAGQKMAHGGLVVDHANNMVGNKPDLDFINDGEEEPMAEEMSSMGAKGPDEHRMASPGMPSPSGLSEEAKRALAAKKKNRRYGQNDPK